MCERIITPEYNIKDNLDTPINQVIKDSSLDMTFRDYFIKGWKEINQPLRDTSVLDTMDNKALNFMLDELSWLLSK